MRFQETHLSEMSCARTKPGLVEFIQLQLIVEGLNCACARFLKVVRPAKHEQVFPVGLVLKLVIFRQETGPGLRFGLEFIAPLYIRRLRRIKDWLIQLGSVITEGKLSGST